MTTSGDVGGRQVWGKNGPLCEAPTCEQGQVRGSLDSFCCPGMSPPRVVSSHPSFLWVVPVRPGAEAGQEDGCCGFGCSAQAGGAWEPCREAPRGGGIGKTWERASGGGALTNLGLSLQLPVVGWVLSISAPEQAPTQAHAEPRHGVQGPR